MKNFFLVINKEKVYAYVVSILTIVILFFISNFINKDLSKVEETSTNIKDNTQIQNNINIENSSKTEENIKI